MRTHTHEGPANSQAREAHSPAAVSRLSFRTLSILLHMMTPKNPNTVNDLDVPWGQEDTDWKVSFHSGSLLGWDQGANGRLLQDNIDVLGPMHILLSSSISSPGRLAGMVSRQSSRLQTPRGLVRGRDPGTHLVRVVEAVIHEPCDQRCLPDCKTKREGFSCDSS